MAEGGAWVCSGEVLAAGGERRGQESHRQRRPPLPGALSPAASNL